MVIAVAQVLNPTEWVDATDKDTRTGIVRQNDLAKDNSILIITVMDKDRKASDGSQDIEIILTRARIKVTGRINHNRPTLRQQTQVSPPHRRIRKIRTRGRKVDPHSTSRLSPGRLRK